MEVSDIIFEGDRACAACYHCHTYTNALLRGILSVKVVLMRGLSIATAGAIMTATVLV